MKRVLSVLLTLAICGAVCAAAAPAVQKYLPSQNAVKGFAPMKGSLQYAKGDDLTNIYNGGYELYTKNGVLDAARQMYSRGNDYVEVTVHTMKSDKAAADFVKYWQKENKVKSLEKTKSSSLFVITKPSVTSYSATGKYFVTVSALYTGDKAKTDAREFFKAIEKLIVK